MEGVAVEATKNFKTRKDRYAEKRWVMTCNSSLS